MSFGIVSLALLVAVLAVVGVIVVAILAAVFGKKR